MMTQAIFEREVIHASSSKPILVDFWAPWCGPCQSIGPILEELEDEASGQWTLVKVNVDESPEVSQLYKIRSIPNLRLFYQGEMIGELSGAHPKNQLSKWLKKHLPDNRHRQLQVVLDEIEQGENDLHTLRRFVKENPDYEEARGALARKLIFTDAAVEEVEQLISAIRVNSEYYETSLDIFVLIKLISIDFTGSVPAALLLREAVHLLKAGQEDKALEALLEAVRVDKAFEDDLPRKATIALFNLLGEEHALTRKHRRSFDMVLY